MNFNRACAHILRAQQLLQFGASRPGFGTGVDYSNLIVAIDFDGTLTSVGPGLGKKYKGILVKDRSHIGPYTDHWVNRTESETSDTPDNIPLRNLKLFGSEERRAELKNDIEYLQHNKATVIVFTKSEESYVRSLLNDANLLLNMEVITSSGEGQKMAQLASMLTEQKTHAILFDDDPSQTNKQLPYVFGINVRPGGLLQSDLKRGVEEVRRMISGQTEPKSSSSTVRSELSIRKGQSHRSQKPQIF